jgi:hypothetical protein
LSPIMPIHLCLFAGNMAAVGVAQQVRLTHIKYAEMPLPCHGFILASDKLFANICRHLNFVPDCDRFKAEELHQRILTSTLQARHATRREEFLKLKAALRKLRLLYLLPLLLFAIGAVLSTTYLRTRACLALGGIAAIARWTVLFYKEKHYWYRHHRVEFREEEYVLAYSR